MTLIKPRPHQHDGGEFIHVLKGALLLRILREEHTLHDGDSIYFDATQPHAYSSAGARGCEALVVTTAERCGGPAAAGTTRSSGCSQRYPGSCSCTRLFEQRHARDADQEETDCRTALLLT